MHSCTEFNKCDFFRPSWVRYIIPHHRHLYIPTYPQRFSLHGKYARSTEAVWSVYTIQYSAVCASVCTQNEKKCRRSWFVLIAYVDVFYLLLVYFGQIGNRNTQRRLPEKIESKPQAVYICKKQHCDLFLSQEEEEEKSGINVGSITMRANYISQRAIYCHKKLIKDDQTV